MNPWTSHPLFVSGHTEAVTDSLICEEPLSIRIEGKPYAVVMRTPGDESAHVAGFCLAEGIVDTPEDIGEIAFCDGDDANVVTITLSSQRRRMAQPGLERRQFVSQTSCGLCGKELVQDLVQVLKPVVSPVVIAPEKAISLLSELARYQPLRQKTRAAHGAAIFNDRLEMISAAEDVGRHNALDKAVGALFLAGQLADAAALVLSSRISYELVQKTARAQIPIILAISRPTSLAVSLAEKVGLTLACRSKNNDLAVYCGRQRLLGQA